MSEPEDYNDNEGDHPEILQEGSDDDIFFDARSHLSQIEIDTILKVNDAEEELKKLDLHNHIYTVVQEVDHGEHAPDADVSLVKIAKEVLAGVKSGSDVTSINLPASVLDPVSSLEKGMKSMQRGEILQDVVAEKDKLKRFLQVLKFVIAGYPKEKFGKKPYNPILGEVFRATFKHKGAGGNTMMIAEQVSHHPPITCLHLHNATLGFSMTSYTAPEPRFWGNSLEVKLSGKAVISLIPYDEDYVITRPSVFQSGILGIGKQRVEFIGDSHVICPKNNLEGKIEFKGKGMFARGDSNAISGFVKYLNSDDIIYEISGNWDKKVTVHEVGTKREIVLFDYDEVKEACSMKVVLPPPEHLEPNNSLKVWESCSQAIWAKDSAAAGRAKKEVEDAQRQIRKEREIRGLVWEPFYFEKVDDEHGLGYKFKESLRPLVMVEVSEVPDPGTAKAPTPIAPKHLEPVTIPTSSSLKAREDQTNSAQQEIPALAKKSKKADVTKSENIPSGATPRLSASSDEKKEKKSKYNPKKLVKSALAPLGKS